jgi:hypothetical protein
MFYFYFQYVYVLENIKGCWSFWVGQIIPLHLNARCKCHNEGWGLYFWKVEIQLICGTQKVIGNEFFVCHGRCKEANLIIVNGSGKPKNYI